MEGLGWRTTYKDWLRHHMVAAVKGFTVLLTACCGIICSSRKQNQQNIRRLVFYLG